MPEEDTLSIEAIRNGLLTHFVGQNIVYFETIDSTNRVAKELAHDGVPEGALVIANAQTGGRGRLNRQWLSPPGDSLLMSLIFRPELTPLQAARITMICSLSIADAIERVTPLNVRIKWPNDILVQGRKTGGILTELGLQKDRLDFIVVGIGLNVNVIFRDESPAFPLDAAPDTSQASLAVLADRSTSLLVETGHRIPRIPLLRQFLAQVEKRYLSLKKGWIPNKEWGQRLATLNCEVTVTTPDKIITGWAEEVDADGALLVRLADRTVVRIIAGDVTLRARGPI